jgi:hypothetical protein
MTPANAASNARAVDLFSRDNCPSKVAPKTLKRCYPDFSCLTFLRTINTSLHKGLESS